MPSDKGKRSVIFDNLLEKYNNLIKGNIYVKDLEFNKYLKEVCQVLDSKKSVLRSSSRTSLLLLEYQSAVAFICKHVNSSLHPNHAFLVSIVVKSQQEQLGISESSINNNCFINTL